MMVLFEVSEGSESWAKWLFWPPMPGRFGGEGGEGVWMVKSRQKDVDPNSKFALAYNECNPWAPPWASAVFSDL